MLTPDPLLIPEIMIIFFILILLLIAYINIQNLNKLSGYNKLSVFPRISVLIPARNEEEKIRDCISSLLKQDYPNYQIIVLNDNSTDRTGEILAELQSRDNRLKVIHGASLPADWLGKHWACHQLYLASDGDYLFFTDADTVHSTSTLTNAMAAMLTENADMISIIPRHILGTLSEKLAMPLFALGVFAMVPLPARFRPRSISMLSSSGKLMMFSRKAYEISGGFAGIRQNVLDDLELPQKIQQAGFRYRLFDGTENVSCRMYHSFKELHEGLTKNMFASYQYNIPVFVITWIWALFAVWEPIIILLLFKTPQYPPTLAHGLAVIAIIGTLSLWVLYYQRFKFPIYMVLFYPVSVTLIGAISTSSMILTLTGQAKWKDRKMPTRKIY